MLFFLSLFDSIEFPFLILLANRFPLVMLSLSPGQCLGNFYLAPLEIHFQRNQGVTLLIDLSIEALYLVLVQEQFPWPKRIVIPVVGKGFLFNEKTEPLFSYKFSIQ